MKLNRGVLKAAEFKGLEWLNSDPIALKDLKGHAVLVHFWDYTYYNCLQAINYIKVWNGRYRDKGLVVIGIHAPEFSFSRKRENVIRAIEDIGIDFPVAMDNEFETWKAFSNRYWPSDYLIDTNGFLADYHIGEGGYKQFETSIQELMREINPHVVLPKTIDALRPEDQDGVRLTSITPDVYLGFRRGRIGNKEGFIPYQSVDYSKPQELARDIYHAIGKWTDLPECLRFEGDGDGEIVISYQANAAVVVVEPGPKGPQKFEVIQDGEPLSDLEGLDTIREGDRTVVHCRHPRLYKIVKNKDVERHTLTLRTKSIGIKFYSLNFITATILKNSN